MVREHMSPCASSPEGMGPLPLTLHTPTCYPAPSHSQGEALVMEPLRLQWDMPDHPVAKHHLVAIGTVDKVCHVLSTPGCHAH